MTVSIKAAKKVTVRGFAKAALVAALLSTLGAAQGIARAMPDNCKENLNQCSLKVWARNSFPHPGFTQSITFSNGETLGRVLINARLMSAFRGEADITNLSRHVSF
jgi:hypothetical protein